MKTALLTLLLCLIAAATAAQDAADSAEQKFLERAAKVKEACADKHVELAKLFRRNGANRWASAELAAALELVPGHEKAKKEQGYRQERVDGVSQWVLDERRAIPAQDSPDLNAKARDALRAEQEKAYQGIAAEFVKLAGVARKSELAVHARVCCEIAVRYDPLNKAALEGAGWVNEGGVWLSPAEVAERAETVKALAEVPQGEPLQSLPEWCPTVYGEGKAIGYAFGKVSVIGSGSDHASIGRYAHAVYFLCADLLGSRDGELRLVLTANKDEFDRYCDTRHPGIEGLKADDYVVGDREVAVRVPANDSELGFERAAYAAALFECRKRCGEGEHPWFERGIASNLTRRLLGRVGMTGHSGEKSGPAEHGRWKRTLRMKVSAGEALEFGKLVVARDPDEAQIMLAHYMTRYLCMQRKAALPGYCAALLAGEDAESALKHGFEQDSAALEAAFVAWFARN